MTTIDATHPETLHVFATEGDMAAATALAADPEALGRALGDVEVVPGRAEAVDPAALADLGLSTYLVEGLGAAVGPVRADAARLDRQRRPVVILLPRAIGAPMSPRTPLEHLGSYALERATPAAGSLHSDAAEETVPGAPPETGAPPSTNRRASGLVAIAALAAALLVALVVWLVAAA